MAHAGGKCKTPASDPGVNGVEDDVASSDGSTGSSLAKIPYACADDAVENRICSLVKPGNNTTFADLFKDVHKSNEDATCSYIQHTDSNILEIESSNIDNINDLSLGFFLIRFFRGQISRAKGCS